MSVVVPAIDPSAGPAPLFARAKCVICERQLTVHEVARARTCSTPACREKQLKRRLAREAHEKNAARVRLEAVRRRTARSSGIEQIEAYPLAVLPANQRPLTELPRERRTEFESYLARSIAEARKTLDASDRELAAGEARSAGDYPGPRASEVLGRGCGTCRGDCCEQGGTHAFLNPEEIGLLMAESPDRDPERTLEDYLSRLAGKTYQGSCVYHGEGGCRLPRGMRSRICNDYYCEGLAALLCRLPERGRYRAFAGAVAEGRVVRAAAIEGGRALLEIEPARR